jgi:cytochrome c biogenesis protein CcmG, thiol:disulfide interchange protein DsbE
MSGGAPPAGPAPAPTPPRRALPARWVAGAVAVPLLVLLGVLATRPPAATRLAQSPMVGKPAPAVTAPTIDGETIRLSAYRGRWVVVNFFATWCVPCRIEHPELVRFHEAHQRLGDLEVVGVVYSDSEQAVREFRAAEGGSWPMLVDPEGRIALEFGVAGVPESYLITHEGVVASKIVGGVRAHDLEALLEKAKTTRS